MTEHLFKLKKTGKVVGYLKISNICMLLGSIDGLKWHYITNQNPAGDLQLANNQWMHFYDTAYPFVTKDKFGKDVFAGDEIKVFDGLVRKVVWSQKFLQWAFQSEPNHLPLPLAGESFELIEDKE